MMQSVSNKQILSLVGGISSSNIQLTCFQIIYREKMKIKSSNKGSFHSLAYKERYWVRDDRVSYIVLAHSNLSSNSLNVLFDLASELVCVLDQQGA